MNDARIDALLTELRATAAPPAIERIDELVSCLLELYGTALARILTLISEKGAMSAALAAAILDDPQIAALLTLHGVAVDNAAAVAPRPPIAPLGPHAS